MGFLSLKFFRRMKAKFAGAVAKGKLDSSQAADQSPDLLQSRPLPSQKGRADLSQGVDDIEHIPALEAGINKDINNKSSSDYLSSSSTFLSSSVYNSRINEHDTTDKDFSSSSSRIQLSNISRTYPINVNIYHHHYPQQAQPSTSQAIRIESRREPASVQEEMENWDESFDFQPTSSHNRGTITSPSTSIAARHKAHSVSVPIPVPDSYMPHSSSLPVNTENWDDSYVYEDDEEEDEENDDISSLGNGRPIVPPILSSRRTGSVEDDVDSWGSGSDWSGDGDIEDLTRDSFRDDTLSSNPGTPAIFEGRLPITSTETPRAKGMKHSGIPRFGRFTSTRPPSITNNAPLALANAAPTKADPETPRNPSNTSFLSKISPVHRWKSPVRGSATPKLSQPFQVNRDSDAPTSSKSLAGERNKKELVIKPFKEDAVANNKVKKQSSRTPLSPLSSSHVHSNSQLQPQRKDSKEKDQGKGKIPMSPIKRVFSGTPLSPKNTSPSSGSSQLHNNGSFLPSSQTSSQSSTSISAEMAERDEHEIPSRKDPFSAPSSTVTSPASKQTITAGTRTKVRYRSKTTTSTNPSLTPAPSTSIQPFHTSSAQNPPFSPPNNANNGLVPRTLSQTPRRSSLNDLKLRIPERISHAQRDIKRDINDVRDFAACVEQLRSLQHVYAVMLRDLRAALSEPVDQAPAQVSPPQTTSFLSISPKKRRGTVSTTTTPSYQTSLSSSPSKAQILKRKFSLAAPPPSQPSIYAVALNKLDNSYGIWWECAEVLIELGGWHNGGGGVVDLEVDVGSPSGNALVAGMVRGRRVRAVTLGSEAGSTVVGVNVVNVNIKNTFDNSQGGAQIHKPRPPTASPPKPSQWRATTGRAGNGRDLTPRQLAILQDMLLGDDEREGRWDPRAMDAERAINDANSDDRSPDVKGRNKRGLRDLWSGFRKSGNSSANESTNPPSTSNFTASQSTSSPTRDSASFDSSASESNRGIPKDPFSPPDSSYDPNTGRPRTPSPSKLTVTAVSRGKKPVRRPSLAGIFGMGQRIVPSPPKGGLMKHDGSSSDWDLMEIDAAANVSTNKTPRHDTTSSESTSPFKPSTIRGRVMAATYESASSPDKKGTSLQLPKAKKPSLQLPRTPNIFHSSDDAASGPPRNEGNTLRSPVRIQSEVVHSSSSPSGSTAGGISVGKLALTPNNIRPLLKHAQEIASHLNECIGEVRGMMGGMSVI